MERKSTVCFLNHDIFHHSLTRKQTTKKYNEKMKLKKCCDNVQVPPKLYPAEDHQNFSTNG